MSIPQSRTLQDELQLSSIANVTGGAHSQLLIYFFPGNPGCVEYYRAFLVDLQNSLARAGRDNVTICGAGHLGFELHEATVAKRKHAHNPPYTLQEVVEGAQANLKRTAREIAGSATPATPISVILIGHSVGAYIVMETVKWWQEQKAEQQLFRIIGGVGLFPTIFHIAKSSNGKPFSWLKSLPAPLFYLLIRIMAVIIQFAARLLALIPIWLWNWPRTLTPGEKMPQHIAATEAVVRSRNGAAQALFMGAHEILELAEDKWHPANIWGVLDHNMSGGRDTSELDFQVEIDFPRTKLFFYWGEDDYWIDNEVRDAFIAKRAKREYEEETRHWPEMILDRHGMDHCFSLTGQHSRFVAEEVASWIANLNTK